MIVAKARKPPQRRFVDEPSGNPLWQLTHRISDKYYTPFRDMMTKIWDRWRDNLNMGRLFDALLGANIPVAAGAIESAWMSAANELANESQSLISEMSAESFADTQKTISSQIGIEFGGPTTVQVRNWTMTHAGEFITQIGDAERQAIRNLLHTGINSGRTVDSMAKEIRQHIGLTTPQSEMISRLREGMESQGLPAAHIEKVVAKRTQKAIRERATVIARNETMIASKQGSRFAYIEAADQGLIDANKARRHWIVTPLDACPTCAPIPGMNPDGVRIYEPYNTPIGLLMEAHAHIQCRCVEVIKL